MKILLIHLSDAHFSNEKHNPLSHCTDQIINAVQGVEDGVEVCFIVFTGDVAQSANSEEYQIAETFISSIVAGISKLRPDWTIEQIFIPGNHDCDLPEEDDIRQLTADSILKELRHPF